MNDSKQHKFSITNVGTITLLMILIVLCMTIFALLSLSTAVSDYQATQRAASHTTDYYAACNQAEEQLAGIDTALQTFYTETSDLTSYQEYLRAYCTNRPDITLNETDKLMTLSWQTPLNDSQALSVVLDILYPDSNCASDGTSPSGSNISAAPSLYRIASWQVVSTSQWEGNNSVTLIGE